MRWRKSVYAIIFAVAMGYLEAAVVVYLRELYYPENILNIFPFKPFSLFDLKVELFREAATLLMLWCVAGVHEPRSVARRFMAFLALWGIWDLTYYVFLKILIGWPQSIFDPDVLFLIPTPWVGPVVAPSMIALTMAVAGGVVMASDIIPKLDWMFWVMLLSGGLIQLGCFIVPPLLQSGGDLMMERLPRFPWPVFVIGFVPFALALMRAVRHGSRAEEVP